MAFRAFVAMLLVVLAGPGHAADLVVGIGYLRQEVEQPPVLSNLDPIPADQGLAGARLGIADNATTGRFLGQSYTLEEVSVAVGADMGAAADDLLSRHRVIVVDAPADVLLGIADRPTARDAILINMRAPETRLRDADCRANLLHSLPSNAMRADALMQALLKKRWTDLAMITGPHPGDLAFAESLRRSATKFGLRLRNEAEWRFDADMRRNAAQEVPLFTQDFRDHDVLLIADELGDFGRYVAYNTWLPRPVAGSEGLRPVAWAPVVEQWGAAQLQSRFADSAGRQMDAVDYAAWAAIRAVGEAVTRTATVEPAALRAFMLSDRFELAGFKGRPQSFRAWNGQMRQPLPLVTDRAVALQAPLEGFLHQRTELDTLGLDAPESRCTAFE